ncbi:2OG-Fe(II) oxygenase [Novosphingobium piscinae]|uniref:2OG-Fe(II) oxygenase n=1 Tax=Novosphingobium piscinae TaxID=1507448 RepID=A0A7X1FX48_9SPHN|nr:2OG-Fe(II) oxygenase [Novosphingobium piscinae]MBC2668633.1 2OG-Fe(II) oxygenase [Novosphingobium piscinae]
MSYAESRSEDGPQKPAPLADRAALVRCGERVRARLAADPAAYRLPTDRAEIFAFGEFLDPAECDRMIALVDATARPSMVYDLPRQSETRTSYSGDVDPADPFVRMIERRIDDLLGLESSWGEAIQGQRYHPGQEFKAHCDWFSTLAEYWPQEARRGGQRGWTAMAYLNAVEEGGVTEFTRLGLSITPQRGALLVWNNATPDGAPNWDTMHAAHPVVRGVKYVITKWYRTRRWG